MATAPANPSIVNIASICGIRGSGKECISYQVRCSLLACWLLAPDDCRPDSSFGDCSCAGVACPKAYSMRPVCDPLTAATVTELVQAAKAGVIGLTLSGAAKLAGHGIRVNAISPSLVNTVRSTCATAAVRGGRMHVCTRFNCACAAVNAGGG